MQKNAGMAASHCWGSGCGDLPHPGHTGTYPFVSQQPWPLSTVLWTNKALPDYRKRMWLSGVSPYGLLAKPYRDGDRLGGAISLSLLMRRCQTTCGTPSSGNGGQQGRRRRQVERPGAWSMRQSAGARAWTASPPRTTTRTPWISQTGPSGNHRAHRCSIGTVRRPAECSFGTVNDTSAHLPSA